MSNDLSEFQRVTSGKEIAKLLEDIRLTVSTMVGQISDGRQFNFSVYSVTGDLIETHVDSLVGLTDGAALEVVFGILDGHYFLRTAVQVGAKGQVSFRIGSEIYRLQRRNNFRTVIPIDLKVDYRLQSFKHALVPPKSTLPVVDFSVGGMRVKWLESLGQPNESDHLGGTLALPQGKTLEVFGVVKLLLPQVGGRLYVGLEFQNVSLKDEQTLLFAAMYIQREHSSRR